MKDEQRRGCDQERSDEGPRSDELQRHTGREARRREHDAREGGQGQQRDGALIGGLASGTAGGALAGAAIGGVGGAIVADVTRPKTTKRCWWNAQGNKVCKYYPNN